jgi:uncharacterized phage protein gp47/JayE
MSDLVNPSDYGVLVTGFSRMRLPEIRQTIIADLNSRIGVIFETRPDSITGQFIDTFAEREATLWELAEAVYHSMYPISAVGVSLDHAVSYAGVRREFAQSSYGWITCFGQEGTIIPAGSIVRNKETQDEFATRNDLQIGTYATGDITFSIDTAVAGETYWVKINSITYSYLCQQYDTAIDITNALAVYLLATGLQQRIDANIIQLWTVESLPFSFQSSTNISIVQQGSVVYVDAVETGPLDISAGNITQIVSTITGWDQVYNIVSGFVGRNVETDDELRLRYDAGVYRLGAATLPSLKANLQQVITGIISVEVFENVDDVVDSDGRVPHSIEVVAYGGDAQQIGEAIFLYKAAGIDTNGSVHVIVTDSSDYTHDIYFNRPIPVYFWVKVNVQLYNEETFPDSGVLGMQTIISDTGNSFGIGKDVIIQRFYGPVYAALAGIGRMDITVAHTSDPNTIPLDTDYVSTNVPISARELSQFDPTRIQVVLLP